VAVARVSVDKNEETEKTQLLVSTDDIFKEENK
jgi:hypothetical protein